MKKFFELFASNLALFLNLLELVALCISVATVLYLMLNKFNRGLKIIFAPCGLGFMQRMKILFICRNSVLKKRAFIEFALLKTQGYSTISSDWKALINQFKAFYAENKSDMLYVIPNCTPLIGENFSKAVKRYFDYLNNAKVKRVFGIRDDRLEWVLKIRIEEAYATPTCLLTGLLSKYEENWEEFIKRYVSTAYITDSNADSYDNIRTDELYFTFGWLLWGPSYELDYKHFWAGLCQLSYGDESNSVPAVACRSSDVIERLKSKFAENEERRYGALLSADVSIYDKKPYYKSVRELTNPENKYFYEKIENGEFSFAVQIDEFTPCHNFKSKKYYCTAYVWLLFELESDEPDFRPEKCVAFFEHANLTDKNAYNFLIGMLIEKSLKHFERIFADPQYAGRRYRFVTAFNDKIASECKQSYAAAVKAGGAFGEALAERVIMQPKRAASVVFSAFDSFFTQSESLEFKEVSLADKGSVSDLAQFYTEIYLESFPDENERESFDNLIAYLKSSEGQDDCRYHILLAKDSGGQVLGGAVFDYFKRTNSAVIEFIAVKSSLQACGNGTAIYKRVLTLLSYDANKNNRTNVDNIFCEIESPETNSTGSEKYLYFWTKNNYKRLMFDYVQPALAADRKPVTSLWLTVNSGNSANAFPSATLTEVLYDYLKYCMQIKNPESNEHFAAMKKELEGAAEVGLCKILQ